MGHFDAEFDVVLRAARRAGMRLIEMHEHTIFLHPVKERSKDGQQHMGMAAAVPAARAAQKTSRQQRSARRAAHDVCYVQRVA